LIENRRYLGIVFAILANIKIMKLMKQNLIILFSLLILVVYTTSCLEESSFSAASITPKNNSKDVPLNAVIKVVFNSEAKLKESYLKTDRFTLGKVVEEVKNETEEKSDSKTESSTSGTNTNSNSNSTEKDTVAVQGLLKWVVNPPSLTSENKTQHTTLVYFIPMPSKSAKSPLEPDTEYVFTISEIKDQNDKAYKGKTVSFTTKDEGFEFSSNPSILKVSEPINTNLFTNPVSPNQEFIVEFDQPVNPFRLNEYTELSSNRERDSLDYLDDGNGDSDTDNDETSDSTIAEDDDRKKDWSAKRFETLEKRLEEQEKRLFETIPDRIIKLEEEYEKIQNDNGITDETVRDTKLADKQKEIDDLLVEGTDLEKNKIPATKNELASIASGVYGDTITTKKEEEKSPKGYRGKAKELHTFSLSFLEDFLKTDNGEDEFIVANYNKVIFSYDFDPFLLYRLTIKASKKGGKAIRTFDMISIDETQDYERTETGLEINFFDNEDY